MTTQLNAMKQALEALEPFSTPHWAGTGVDKANEAITSLLTAIAEAESRASEQAEKHEPVNWSVYNSGAEVASGLTFAEAWDYMTPERLARDWCAVCVVDQSNMPMTSPAAPVQEQCPNYDDPMREEMWKIGFNAAQRQSARSAWVGLTDEELEHIFDTNVGDPHPRYPITLMDWVNFARAIEAKLKEKNT